MRRRKWRVGIKKRFRIPIRAIWLYPFIPQPHWLKRWYYKMSFKWWGHPSNHHWKMCLLIGEGGYISNLLPGERDIWTGMYCSIASNERG